MGDQTPAEFAYAADHLYSELRRTWPEEMTKQELLDASGLSSEEARAGLELLERQGRLDASGGQLKAVVDGEAQLRPEDEEGDVPEDAPEPVQDAPPPGSSTVVPGQGETYHSHYTVMVAFGQSPGTKPEAAVKTARAMEEEIADRIHAMYEGVIVGVELQRVEVSQPRVIYGGGEDEQGA